MDFRHYSDNGAALAAALATAFMDEEGRDREPQLSELTDLFAAHDVRRRVRGADVEGLRALARRLREVFVAPDTEAAAAVVNDLLRDTAATPWITMHDGRDPHLHFAQPGTGLVEHTAASTAMALAIVLCDYGKERLGVCAADHCTDAFIDTSRNAQRRFCSQGCANRTNVAAHRARKRESAPD
jgi:predicted RNA-binding Zn ribbon-like protein